MKDVTRPAGSAVRNVGIEAVGFHARMMVVAFAPYPLPPHDPALDQVAEALDPVLVPLGFAAGQVGSDGARGQVIFCRGDIGTSHGACVDLVVDLGATPDRQITDVHYWGYSS